MFPPSKGRFIIFYYTTPGGDTQGKTPFSGQKETEAKKDPPAPAVFFFRLKADASPSWIQKRAHDAVTGIIGVRCAHDEYPAVPRNVQRFLHRQRIIPDPCTFIDECIVRVYQYLGRCIWGAALFRRHSQGQLTVGSAQQILNIFRIVHP